MKEKLKNWLVLNVALLAVYLGFFHLCLLFDSSAGPYIGICCTLAWVLLIRWKKAIFKNAYEYFFYAIVGLDILIEGFIPFHEGYGFYYCALAFWSIFLLYHFIDSTRLKCLGSRETAP